MKYIPPPNYTQVPNAVLEAMPQMGEAELRVIMAICRKTFGWQKDWDRISISQLADLTGLTRRNAHRGVHQAIDRGWVSMQREGQNIFYRVQLRGDLTISLRDTTVTLGDTPTVTPRDTEPYPLGIVQKKKERYKERERKKLAHPIMRPLNGSSRKREPHFQGAFIERVRGKRG